MSMRSLLAAVALTTVASAGCSSFGDSSSSADTLVDRLAVEEALVEITVDRLDGANPSQGAVLEDCPVLGDRTVADLVSDSGVDIDVADGRESGFLHGVGDGVFVSCRLTADEGGVSVGVHQTIALDTTEFVAQERRLTPEDMLDEITFDTDVSEAGFEPGSLLTRTRDDVETLVWVDNGLAIAVTPEANVEVTRAEVATLLATTRDAMLETLQGSTDGPGDGSGHPVGLDRDRVFQALDDIEPRVDGGRPVQIEDGRCPFLSGDGFDSVASELEWAGDPEFSQGSHSPPARSTVCSWGDPPEARTIAIAFGRPVSVAEVKAHVEGPIFEPEWSVDPLDAAGVLEDRSYVVDRGSGPPVAGWVDNGLRIQVDLAGGEDAEDVLAVVVPAVLGELDLD